MSISRLKSTFSRLTLEKHNLRKLLTCFAYMVDVRIFCVYNFALQTLLDRKMKDFSHFSKTCFFWYDVTGSLKWKEIFVNGNNQSEDPYPSVNC